MQLNPLFIILFLLVASPFGGYAQLTIDSTFGNNGKIRFSIDNYHEIHDIHTLEDDTLLILGRNGHLDTVYFDSDLFITKRCPDGLPDTTFGDSGIVKLDFRSMHTSAPKKLAILGDGRILVIGGGFVWDDAALKPVSILRILPDGQVDSTFGINGTLHLDFLGVAEVGYCFHVFEDGSFLVGGSSMDTTNRSAAPYPVMGKFTAEGIPDSSFGGTGKILVSLENGSFPIRHSTGGVINEILVLEDGKLLVSGGYGNGFFYQTFFARFDSNGTTDSTFHQTGYLSFNVTTNGANQAIQMLQLPNGKIFYGVSSEAEYQRDFYYGTLDMHTLDYNLSAIDFDNNEDVFTDLYLTETGSIIMVGASMEYDNIQTFAYYSDYFAIVQFPDYENIQQYTSTLIPFEQGYQCGAHACSMQSDNRLVVGGITYTDSSEIIDGALMRIFLEQPEVASAYQPDLAKTSNLNVYPNPTKETLYIETNTYLENAKIYLYDLQGRTILQFEKNLAPAANVLQLPELPKGLYIMNISSQQQAFTKKIKIE